MLKWYAKKLENAGTKYRIEHNNIYIFYDEGVEDSVEYRLFIKTGQGLADKLWIASLLKMGNKIIGDGGVRYP